MNTKLIAALVTLGILTIAIIGLVSAQIPTPTSNGTSTANNGFFGWMGRCFGFRSASITGNQPVNITITDPNTNTTTTYQSHYGYRPCMGRYLP